MKKLYILLIALIAFNCSKKENPEVEISGWTKLNSGTTIYLRSIYFTDANTGYVVGYNGTILKTTDAGLHWTKQNSGTTELLFSVYFIDTNTGYAAGGRGVGYQVGGYLIRILLKTSNGGESWNQLLSDEDYPFSSIFFTNTDTGYALSGGVLFTPTIMKTTNGGMEWTSQYSGTQLSEQLWSIYFSDANTGYAVGCGVNSGIMLRTTDAGMHWIKDNIEGTVRLHDVYFTDADTGYVVGLTTILKTTNGGLTWTIQNSNKEYGLYSVFFTDANTGYAVGSPGAILKTTNGGLTWTSQNSGTSSGLSSVYFTDANTGYAIGYDNVNKTGIILKTTTGGEPITE